eukprot:TRINITY_DN805_c0_g1_i1.p1 TRINITY_DN805_c0_g1~~TRINITY_DN805_c0_g1_i1.p1  ORF type:complete len:184 (+),score=54.17 TRINITY_DN805_c0_g1_i1:54-605(+)
MSTDPKTIERIASSIRNIPDYPKPGIQFKDITTLLLDPEAFALSLNVLAERYKASGVNKIAGLESRGFIFGAPLANIMGIPFVPFRKPRKLPGETISVSYSLEYGEDTICVHKGHITSADKVLLVDDLVATGGTLLAGAKLIELSGGELVECACVIELPDLHGRKKLEEKGIKLFTIVPFDGE